MGRVTHQMSKGFDHTPYRHVSVSALMRVVEGLEKIRLIKKQGGWFRALCVQLYS